MPLSTVPTMTVLLLPSRPIAVTEPGRAKLLPPRTRLVSALSGVKLAPPLLLRLSAGVAPSSSA